MIFVLHGFASATPNIKFKMITDHFKDQVVVGLNYDFDPVLADKQLTHQIETAISKYNDTEVIFIGTSLGGLLAKYYAGKYSGKAVLINPCIEPNKTLKRYIGNHTNYVTGKKFIFTKEHYLGFNKFVIPDGQVSTLVLLDLGDDIINPMNTMDKFADNSIVKTFDGGSHGFDHLKESFPYINTLINTFV